MDIFKLLSPNQLINKILENEALADALLKALSVSLEAKKQVESQYEQSLSTLSLAPLSRLQAAEEELKIFEDELEALRDQLTRLSSEARQGRQAALELKEAQGRIKELSAELALAQQELSTLQKQSTQDKGSKDHTASPEQAGVMWSKKMTKGQLLSLARELGLELKGAMKKSDMISALTDLCGPPADA